MVASVERGAVRECFFATMDAPGTKYSFLVRDDAFSKAGVVFGKTLRLGDPVHLGPNSTWRTTTWEGGRDQEQWRDDAMYKKGFADTTIKRGKARLWGGWKQVTGTLDKGMTRYVLQSGGAALTGGNDFLYLGEGHHFGNGKTPATLNVGLYKYTPGGVLSTVKSDFAATINAIGRISRPGDTGVYLLVGLADGSIHRVKTSDDTVAQEAAPGSSTIEQDSIATFGKEVFYGAGSKLWKRTDDGTTVTHSQFFDVLGATTVRGLAVWNARLWFCSLSAGGLTQVWVTDGVTEPTVAFQFPEEFQVRSMVAHWGSLYFVGDKSAPETAAGFIGQVWKYTGGSLTKLWELNDESGGFYNFLWDCCTWKQYLVWGRPGLDTTDDRPGVMMYDAELDAIVDGPTLDSIGSSTGVQVCSLTVWNDTLVASFWDGYDYPADATVDQPIMAAFVRSYDQVRHSLGAYNGNGWDPQPSTRSQSITSSLYDADIPGESKTWLTGRLRCKVPQNSQIVVKVILDDSGTEQTIKTVTYSGDAGWRTVTFPIKVNGTGAYLKSAAIQYVLYLENTHSADVNSTANPEVDSIEVDFQPAPQRRRQWSIRVPCDDAQLTVAGAANSLATAQALDDKLEEFWSDQEPLWFWPPRADGAIPADTTTAVEVKVTSYNSQSYRVRSDDNETASEVGIEVLEVVTS